MNGRQAKHRRRDSALSEKLLQAHDRLHRSRPTHPADSRVKDDVDGCHEILHAALGAGEMDQSVAPLGHRAKFNAAFERLCLVHGVQAAFVIAEPPKDGMHRLISGGDGGLCALIDNAVRHVGEVVT